LNEQKYTSHDLYEHFLKNIKEEYQFQKNIRYEILIEPNEGAKNRKTTIDFKKKGKIILPFDPENFKKQKDMFPFLSKDKSFPDYIIIPEPEDENNLFILHVELKSDEYNKQK